jgi:hypothetical protein
MDPFFRRMTMIAGIFAFIGVILGVVALSTNYWTMETVVSPGMPMQTSNGTMMMNEKFDWTWNVSFTFFLKIKKANLLFRDYFICAHHVLMYHV